MTSNETTTLACRCGGVTLSLDGAPLMAAECHCESCRRAARHFATRLPGAPDVIEGDGGVAYVAYRKDRVRVDAPPERLIALRLTPKSATRRVAAGCCGTPLWVEVKGGHWLSLYRRLWPLDRQPPLEAHAMTRDRAPGSPPLVDGLPASPGHGGRFMRRLLLAWVAMRFRSPKFEVGGRLDP